MNCPSCHHENPGGAKECSICGAVLNPIRPPQPPRPEHAPAPAVTPPAYYKNQPPENKSLLYICTVVGVIIIMVVLAFTAYFYFYYGTGDSEPEEQTLFLEVGSVDLGGDYLLGQEPGGITVEVMLVNRRHSAETAFEERIQVRVFTNVFDETYNWTGGDLEPGDILSQDYRAMANKDTGAVSVSVYYDGKLYDTKNAILITF